MIIDVRQVGKRWFQCLSSEEKPLVIVEASFKNGHDIRRSEPKSKEAGYDAYDWIPVKFWSITGTGARKYRKEIISAILSKMEESQ